MGVQKYFDPRGQRLVYVNRAATQDFWDEKWLDRFKPVPCKSSPNSMVVRTTEQYLPQGSCILEGGCGFGEKCFWLAEAGYDVVALDHASKTVDLLQREFPHLTSVVGDVRSLAFEDGSFDGYWSLGVIEHFWDGYGEIRDEMAAKIEAACDGVAGKTLAILGVTFKPNTDDMREAPSLVIVPSLQEAGAEIRIYDPQGNRTAPPLLPGAQFVDDPYAAIEGSDALVILTEWEAFRALDLDRVKHSLTTPLVIDLRDIYRPDEMEERGFLYTSVGRP